MSHPWLRTDISANRYVDTYFKGFVDISGGDLYLRHGQMGIGTTNPSDTLDVSGNVAITGENLYIGNDSNDSLRFNHINNGSTSFSYIDYNDNGSLYFRPTSTGLYPVTMTLTKDGNVGIGTTSPGKKLHVAGQGQIDDLQINSFNIVTPDPTTDPATPSSGTTYAKTQHSNTLVLGAKANTVNIWHTGKVGINRWSPDYQLDVSGHINSRGDGTGNVRLGGSSNEYHVWCDAGTTALRFGVNGGEKMRIDASGNVGIGTTSPKAKLHIEYKGGKIGDFTGLRIANHATNLHATSRPAYEFIVSDLADTTINSDGTISGGIGASKFSIRYRTTNNESDPYYDRLIIDNAGNIGIGTTTPGYKLDVSGSVSAQRGTNGHVSYFGNVAIGDLGFDNHAGIAFHRSTTYDTSFALLQSIGGETILNSSADQSIKFQVGNLTKMIIDNAHNVGIGTVTPGSAYKLDVNGTIHGTSLNINSSNFTVDSIGNISANSLSTTTSITNSQLANSAITIAGTSTSLGGSIAADTIADNIGSGKITNDMLAGSITNGKLANSTITIAGTSTSLGGSIAADTIASAIQSHITDVGELNGLDVNGPVHVYPNGGSGEGGEITLAYPYISSSSATQNKWHINVNASSRFRIFRCEGSSPCVNAIDISTNGNIGIGGDPDSGGSKLKMYGQVDMNSNWVANAGGVNAPYYQGSGNVLFKANNIATLESTNSVIKFTTGSTERMRITNAGNVGIGTTSPLCPLDVRGTGTGYFSATTGASEPEFSYLWRAGINSRVQGLGSSSTNYSIHASALIGADGFHATENTWNSSDRRIKTNIQDLNDEEALEHLRKIQPKKYSYKDISKRGTKEVFGFIAQEVSDVLSNGTKFTKECIPNIYENVECQTDSGGTNYDVIVFTDFETEDLDPSSNTIKLYKNTEEYFQVNILEVIDSQTIRVDTDLSEWMGAIDASGIIIPNEVQTYEKVILDASNNVVLENYDIEPIASIDASDNVVGKMTDLTGDNTIDSSGNYVDASGNTIAAINADGHYIDASGNYFDTDGNFKDASGSLIGTYKAEWKNVIINGTSIFVYGQEVDDFHILNKNAIFTVATAALQEVDRQLQAEKAKTIALEAKTVTLESDLAAEKAKVATMESQMADIFARLQALESA